MESSGTTSLVRCIDYDGDGKGLCYECNDLNVRLNYREETMLYAGQLLLIKDDQSENASRMNPSQRLRNRAQTRNSPKQDKNSAACSKVFSALKVADVQFNSPSTTPGTCTATITKATTSTAKKHSTTPGTCTATVTATTTSKANLKEHSMSARTKDNSSSAASTSAKTSASKTESTSSTLFNFTNTETKTTVAQSVTSSGMLNNASSFIDSTYTTGLQKQQGSSSPASFLFPEAPARAKGNAKKMNVGASKSRFPSSQEDHLNESARKRESEENDRKLAVHKRKVKSAEKDESDVDSSRGKERGKGRNISNSLTKELLTAQLQCFQIQHSLYRVLVTKLRNKESRLELEASQLPRDFESEELQSLLLPLETILRCSDIQLGLHHSLNVALERETGRSQDDGEDYGYRCTSVGHMIYDKDELLTESRSLMNHTKFAQSLVCLHLSNPYSSNLKYACGEDRIFSFDSLNWASNYYVPHGEGKLVSLDGNLIYEGQWKKGKRWGNGKAFIFSGNELSASKKQYGIYEGQWWSNMRHGHGRQVFASCAVYEGEWQYDVMSGVGAMHSPDGSVLEGLWDEDEPSGCGMFTWPNGSVEYREYQNGQVVRVVQSTEETKKISPLNEVMREYSILRLKYQMLEEGNARLVKLESKMKEQQSKAENDQQAKMAQVKQLRRKFAEVFLKHKKKIIEEHQEDLQKLNERHDKTIKDLEDKIYKIEADLEGKQSDLMCQICFERYRNCILMPCSHLLYCQICIAKIQSSAKCGKRARCPACREAINSQINCNLN